MAPAATSRHTRRALLTAAAGAAAAAVADAAIRPLPAAAAGNDGTDIRIGGLYADAQSQTTLANRANNETVLWVASNEDLGQGAGTAIVGYSAKGIGVQGQGGRVGVHGTSTKEGGVFGKCDAGYGVWGLSATKNGVVGSTTSGTGVVGSADSGTGVVAASNSGIGIDAHSTSGIGIKARSEDNAGIIGESFNSIGILGRSTKGSGITGESIANAGVLGSSPDGTGVHAVSQSGTALAVDGKAHFSRSGQTIIAAGRSSLTINLAGTTPASMIFAVLATNRSGRWVRAVVSATDKFTVYLNASLASRSTLTWFVLD